MARLTQGSPEDGLSGHSIFHQHIVIQLARIIQLARTVLALAVLLSVCLHLLFAACRAALLPSKFLQDHVYTSGQALPIVRFPKVRHEFSQLFCVFRFFSNYKVGVMHSQALQLRLM